MRNKQPAIGRGKGSYHSCLMKWVKVCSRGSFIIMYFQLMMLCSETVHRNVAPVNLVFMRGYIHSLRNMQTGRLVTFYSYTYLQIKFWLKIKHITSHLYIKTAFYFTRNVEIFPPFNCINIRALKFIMVVITLFWIGWINKHSRQQNSTKSKM